MPVRCLSPESERAMWVGDVHCPFFDPVAVDLIFAFARWFKPDAFFCLGDWADFYAVSRFDKDPQRLLSLQDELNTTKSLLGKLRQTLPNARIVYLEGNHESRLVRYLWQHPEISTLDNLRLPVLLGLDDLEIEHYDYSKQLQWHGLLIEHGDRVRGKSAATARAMMEARGVSGITGHTHRLAAYYRTDNSGVKVWYENGCACQLRPSYIIGAPDWQQGFTVGYALKGRQRFLCEQIPILSGRLFYAGKLWEAETPPPVRRARQ